MKFDGEKWSMIWRVKNELLVSLLRRQYQPRRPEEERTRQDSTASVRVLPPAHTCQGQLDGRCKLSARK